MKNILTEDSNVASFDIDLANTKEIVRIINEEDKKVALAIEKAMPEIDILITLNDYNHFGKFLSSLDSSFIDTGLSFDKRILATPSFSAYLRIADGCSNNCTYCAIPLIRGAIKSRTIEDIIVDMIIIDSENSIKAIKIIADDKIIIEKILTSNKNISIFKLTFIKNEGEN